MRVRLGLCLFALCLASAMVGAVGPQQPVERITVDVLLDRAAWYLDYFIDQFENVVAEEFYIQDSSVMMPTYLPGGRNTVPAPPSAADLSRARHRDLRSDFLLVKSPDTSALVPFRDVIAVDGVVVRDREARLAKLFLGTSKDAMEQAEAVRAEGARYNLGNMRSTLGNPVLALGVLQASYQARFRFTLSKEDHSVGPGVWAVDFKEDAPPAMIRGEASGDLFSHGRLWIEAATGRVVKTEIQVQQPSVRADITTTFRLDERFGIAVPMEMREHYTFSSGNRVNNVATYGRFRRFDVNADEEIHSPTRTITDEVTGAALVELPAGRYTMGSGSKEAGRNDDETLHDVELTKPFFLGRYEVTQQEWRTVMGTAPSQFATCGPRCPVENVSFLDVQQFLTTLNERAAARKIAGAGTPNEPSLRFRLPTEAEWEYACRARTTGPFSTGENLTTAQANYNGKSPYLSFPAGEFRQRPTPVGAFPLNAWGLADMHGNVWEWTGDWYGPYAETAMANVDPRGPSSGDKRVIRGGAWNFDANSARCGLRYTHAPGDRGFGLGFRLAADLLR
jgi:formylglycine-generating enzyme required for sulfatase activity